MRLGPSLTTREPITTMPTTRPSSDQGGDHNSIGVAPGSVEGVVGSYGRGAAHGSVASGDRITGNKETAENKAENQKWS